MCQFLYVKFKLKMKFKYNKQRLFTNLFVGILWFILGTVGLLLISEIIWFNIGYLLIGLLYLGMFLYEYHYQHLTLYDGILRQHIIFASKQLKLKEITSIKKNVGELILYSKNNKMIISTQTLDKNAWEQLSQQLKTLNVQWI